ncbi:hypothetical protein HELRODRAFT_74464 [Helobdella robusta]|uniref:Translocon-associated protein subunit beta n=1 Tax=Helobdella robusta TaxID=6412 RepID=T1G1R4_HELRO|nr:hypothetical protein HELRODRAFT_74464 [Helobdella robusta]ESO08775.1 hypothetical protein HELRODRAFT_74464 [Helobdella robusta]
MDSFVRQLVCLTLSVLLIVPLTFGEDEENAKLLVAKSVLNNILVEDKELTVQYDVYNVGTSAAYEVKLEEKSFQSTDFEVLHGSLVAQWNRIGPGTNVTHVIVLKPLKSGYFNFSAAEISYLPSENDVEPQTGYTSSLGEGYFMNYKDYDRRFSAHVLDWSAFVIMTLPSLAIPYLLWHQSKNKYEHGKSKKN